MKHVIHSILFISENSIFSSQQLWVGFLFMPSNLCRQSFHAKGYLYKLNCNANRMSEVKICWPYWIITQALLVLILFLATCVLWVYAPEIYPTYMRTTSIGILNSIKWVNRWYKFCRFGMENLIVNYKVQDRAANENPHEYPYVIKDMTEICIIGTR